MIKAPIRSPILDENGYLTAEWQRYFMRADATVTSATRAVNDVTLGTPSAVQWLPADTSGKVYGYVTVPFTPPSPLNDWDHVTGLLADPDDVPTVSKAIVQTASGDTGFFVGPAGTGSNIASPFRPTPFGPFHASEPMIVVVFPAAAASRICRVYALSGSKTTENTLAPAGQTGATPSVTFQADPLPTGGLGQEYAPCGQAFAVTIEYRVADGGQNQWRMKATWTSPTSDPNYAKLGGYDVTIQGSDGVDSLITSPSKNDTAFTSDWWLVPSTPIIYIARLVSWDVGAHKNSVVTGVTPAVQFIIQRQAGGAGAEYTTLVASPTAAPEYLISADGLETWRLSATWVPPTDPTYGGVTVVARFTSGGSGDIPLGVMGPTDTALRTSYFPIGADAVFDIYFQSYDTNSRSNTIVPGTTPRVTGVAVSKQTAGKLKLNRADTATLAATLAINAALLGIAPSSISDTHITPGGISSPSLTTGQIDVGGGINHPARFRVYDSVGNPIGWIGDDSGFSGYVGAWFKQIYIGGSGPAGAPLQADSLGNVTINGATLTLNLNGVTTTIANVSGGNNYAGIKVRHNTGSYYATLEAGWLTTYSASGLPAASIGFTSGAGYIGALQSGAQIYSAGTVEAYVNFVCGGTNGVASTTFTSANGKTVTVKGGIITSVV